MDWIDLANGGDRWQAIVNAVKNLQVPYTKWRTSGLAKN
jgi:hypothetical protein